ncbi:hypothetical protein P154DRAFT_590774 [Amniculicola lignicola CBS 123094]|uniref:Uncharacterized protein n=1 Tax=Amniculicola lignicola CBS 123094 TaxID=1392246 RepID=A0A6A5WRX1_9PLEO|nr:hypothetical protein P154DRAFT_590774 [Amniculicola lignicola CBS 123094]
MASKNPFSVLDPQDTMSNSPSPPPVQAPPANQPAPRGPPPAVSAPAHGPAVASLSSATTAASPPTAASSGPRLPSLGPTTRVIEYAKLAALRNMVATDPAHAASKAFLNRFCPRNRDKIVLRDEIIPTIVYAVSHNMSDMDWTAVCAMFDTFSLPINGVGAFSTPLAWESLGLTKPTDLQQKLQEMVAEYDLGAQTDLSRIGYPQ